MSATKLYTDGAPVQLGGRSDSAPRGFRAAAPGGNQWGTSGEPDRLGRKASTNVVHTYNTPVWRRKVEMLRRISYEAIPLGGLQGVEDLPGMRVRSTKENGREQFEAGVEAMGNLRGRGVRMTRPQSGQHGLMELHWAFHGGIWPDVWQGWASCKLSTKPLGKLPRGCAVVLGTRFLAANARADRISTCSTPGQEINLVRCQPAIIFFQG